MAFIDDLALVELLIGLVAVLMAYVGVLAFWAIRTNNAAWLRSTLRSSAIPIGGIGGVTLALAMWTEIAWPYGLTFLGGYNIFFGDVMVLFGLVAVAFAAAAYLGHHLHVVGLLALVAGIATAFYGWIGYTASPAFTKEPFDTMLMYGAFGMAAVAAFPATIITDYYLHAVESGRSLWQRTVSATRFRGPLGTRAAQPMSKVASEVGGGSTVVGFRVPAALQLVMLAFPVLMTCAAVAAFWYFGSTLPGHLGNGPGKAP